MDWLPWIIGVPLIILMIGYMWANYGPNNPWDKK